MVANPTALPMSVGEYLELERASQVKHEYVDGYVYAMSGGTPDHGVITINVAAALRNQLRGGPCRVYSPDVKVQLSPTRYVYPDVTVGCDERDRNRARAAEDHDRIYYPTLAVEVLSPTTEAYDRGDKFALYQANAALQQYVLVNVRKVAVEVYTRGEHGFWLYRAFGPGEQVELESVGFHGPIEAFYEDADLAEADHQP